jgi:purine-cytosine permease-like protein
LSDVEPPPPKPPRRIKIGRYSIPVPQSRPLRIALGIVLILFGILGFLPLLGFWMIPLGLLVLSVDFPIVRRWQRRFMVWWNRRKKRK